MGLFTAVPAWRNRKIILRHWPKLALYGALSSALFQALSYRAAETTTATNMAIVTALIPLLSMLLSVVVLRDPLTLGMAVGGVLSFLGLLYLVGRATCGRVPQRRARGRRADAAGRVFLCAVRRAAASLEGAAAGLAIDFRAIVLCAALHAAAVSQGARRPGRAGREDRAADPVRRHLSSVLLSFLWIEGVHRLGPNRCSIFINLLPLFTAMAAFALREQPHGYHLLGGAVTLAGVLLAQTVQRPLFGRGAGAGLAAGKA